MFSYLGAAPPARAWCTKPRKTLFLRFLCTKSQARFGAGSAGTWCTKPRKALSSVPFAPSFRFVSPRSRPCWRLAPREAIFHRRATPTWSRYSRLAASLLASPRRRRLGSGRRGARRRRNKGLRGAAHHVRPNTGALDPEDVVLGDERIRDCGERRTTSSPRSPDRSPRHTTSSQPTCAGQELPAPLRSGPPAAPAQPLAPARRRGSFCGYAFHQFAKKV